MDARQREMPMSNNQSRRCIFVASSIAMSGAPGGQQQCTAEYLDLARAAALDPKIVVFRNYNTLRAKMMRRLRPGPYRWFVPEDLAGRVVAAAREAESTLILLNVADTAPVAAQIKLHMPDARIILLSHGLASVDYLHEIRARTSGMMFAGLRRADRLMLADQLVEEVRQRAHLDGVVCLAAFEAEIERWLGARAVIDVPRTVFPAPLDWCPVDGRVGFVGRLDHPPNREALEDVLACLAARDLPGEFELRLVGLPGSLGDVLARRHRFVTYLGALGEAELQEEAASWSCFLHPIFCFARGASTKLATGAGWGLPVVTTQSGIRGYEWSSGGVRLSRDPDEFASMTLQLAFDTDARTTAASDVRKLVENSVTLAEAARRFRLFVDRVVDAP